MGLFLAGNVLVMLFWKLKKVNLFLGNMKRLV